MNTENAIVVFQGKNIRRVWHNEEWWFSIVDIVGVLTESADAKDYWYRLKKRELNGLSQKDCRAGSKFCECTL